MKISTEKRTTFKHELLLASLVVLLFGPIIIPSEYHEIARPFLYVQTVFSGIILFSEWRILRNLMTLLFFLLVSIETYRQIYNAVEVKAATLSAVFSGFILLCLVSSLIFLIIENQRPGSFFGIGPLHENYQNLTYFSFTTTLTIGFGDIVPLTAQAKRAVMLVSLMGNFYTVIVTGIIIGKYRIRKK